MSIFLFDTETTGFPSDNIPAYHPAQAHICQIAMLQLDNDFTEKDAFVSLVKPEGKWKISDGAFKVHRISTQECEEKGIPINIIIDRYLSCYDACHSMAGHNISFDLKMLAIEHGCLNVPFSQNGKRLFCTMNLMTPIMRLPHKRRNAFGTTYKWPTLGEAYSFVTQGRETLNGSHDALIDIRATAKVLKYLVDNKHISIDN